MTNPLKRFTARATVLALATLGLAVLAPNPAWAKAKKTFFTGTDIETAPSHGEHG